MILSMLVKRIDIIDGGAEKDIIYGDAGILLLMVAMEMI